MGRPRLLRGSIDRVPDQEGLGIGWLTRRLADLCMCAQRSSLAGWLAVKGVNWCSGLATGWAVFSANGWSSIRGVDGGRERTGQELAAENYEVMYRGTTRATVLWAAGCRLRSERKWEGGRDGASGVLALVIQISHPRLDWTWIERMGRSVLYRHWDPCTDAASSGTEQMFLLGLTVDISLTCSLFQLYVHIF